MADAKALQRSEFRPIVERAPAQLNLSFQVAGPNGLGGQRCPKHANRFIKTSAEGTESPDSVSLDVGFSDAASLRQVGAAKAAPILVSASSRVSPGLRSIWG